MFEDTITIFNLKDDTWHPTVLKDVEVQERTGRTESKDGNVTQNTCRISIKGNALSEYHRPMDWNGEGYTIRENDFVVIGEVAPVQPISEENYVDGYMSYMKANYDGVYNIHAVSIHKLIPHIEVTAS